jgi:nucleotide sugar dehydrogenase
MSPSAIRVKTEEIDTIEKREKYTVSIIDNDRTGILCACIFAKAGFKVTYANPDQTIVNLLAKGKATFLKQETENVLKSLVRNSRLTATSDIKSAVSKSDIIGVAVGAKIDEKNKVDFSEMENMYKKVGSNLHLGSLVIVLGTVEVGATEGVIKEILENTSGLKSGVDFGLAYSPNQASISQKLESLEPHERVAAASEKTILDTTSIIVETVAGKNPKRTTNVKAAEAAVLFDNVQDDVNGALANEFGFFCEKAGLDLFEVSKLFNSETDNTTLSPTLAEKSVQEKTCLLIDNAENLNSKLRIPSIAKEINDETLKHVITLTQNALRTCDKTLRRARIALLGISQTPNARSPPKVAAKRLTKMLVAKGARVCVHDPYFMESELSEVPFPFKRSLTEAIEGADCIIILTAHDQFKRLNFGKLKIVMRVPAAIVDLEGIVEPDKIEKEGFIYRGLGRGVWKK